MLVELSCDGEVTRADLADGVIVVGGGPKDAIRVPGLRAGAVTLRIDGERVTVHSLEPISIGKALFPAKVSRLWVAPEIIQLSTSVSLRRVSDERPHKGTATVFRDLLAGHCELTHTRAATLTCLTGPDAGAIVPLAFEELLIGRGEGCGLQLRDASVSRRHAKIHLRDDRAVLEDLRGANGTYLNGVVVKRRAVLAPGDVIELGHTVLRYDAPSIAAAASAVADSPSVVVDERQLTEPVPAVELGSRWLGWALAGGAGALLVAAAAAATALW